MLYMIYLMIAEDTVTVYMDENKLSYKDAVEATIKDMESIEDLSAEQLVIIHSELVSREPKLFN